MLKNLKYTLFIIVSLLFFNNLYSQGWPRVYGDNIRAHVYDLKEDYDNEVSDWKYYKEKYLPIKIKFEQLITKK